MTQSEITVIQEWHQVGGSGRDKVMKAWSLQPDREWQRKWEILGGGGREEIREEEAEREEGEEKER